MQRSIECVYWHSAHNWKTFSPIDGIRIVCTSLSQRKRTGTSWQRSCLAKLKTCVFHLQNMNQFWVRGNIKMAKFAQRLYLISSQNVSTLFDWIAQFFSYLNSIWEKEGKIDHPMHSCFMFGFAESWATAYLSAVVRIWIESVFIVFLSVFSQISFVIQANSIWWKTFWDVCVQTKISAHGWDGYIKALRTCI